MTMIEQVVRGIFKADYPNDNWSRFKIGDVIYIRYMKLAKATIKEMRQPTRDMLNEMASKALSNNDSYDSIWKAAIDAALKE